MKYLKRNWEETRGDEFDSWGKSVWYFEVENSGEVIRQIQVYDNGKILKYYENFLEDAYGGLSDQELDLNEFQNYEISKDEFLEVWNKDIKN